MRRLPVLISLVGLLILMSGNATQPAAAQTALPRFNLVNNAVLLEDRLRLTGNEGMQTGAAWLPDKQQVQDGFEVTFGWQINRANPRRGADGFAFVIHNADLPFPGLALGGGRNGLGYSGIPNSLAVEFDTVRNLPEDFGLGTKGDPNDNHISVQTRGKEGNSANTDFSLGFTSQTQPAIPLFADGSVHTTKLVYTPGTLRIFLDDLTKPVLTVPVDLGTTLRLDEGQAWVGLTAATGNRSQAHDILSFVGTEEAPPSEEANNFTAQLDGDQEVPPRETEATGEASFQLSDETELEFTLTVVNIQNLVAAHIHCAPAGENGPVGVTLFGPVAPGGGAVDTFSAGGSITTPDAGNGCEWADVAAVVEAMRSGNAYVNVHTDDGDDPPDTGPGDFPGGEIRGQIQITAIEPKQVTLNPSKDNTLYQDASGALSNGAGQHFFVGNTNNDSIRRGIIAFDIAGNIPAGATINSVTLTLNLSRTLSDSPQPVALHKLLADWGEGASDASDNEGSGIAATPGDATWIHRFFEAETWVKPGGDFAVPASASTPVAGVASYTWGPTPEMVADVQGWLDDPSSNFGWLLVGNERENGTVKRFDSKENPVAERSPSLTIEFTLPGSQ